MRPNIFVPSVIPPWRLSCLRELVAGKVIEIWGSTVEQYVGLFTDATDIRTAGMQSGPAIDIVICVDSARTDEFLASPCATTAADAGAILIAWQTTPEIVRFAARHCASYLQRTMTGVLLRDARFPRSQVAVLREAIEERSEALFLCLWSNEPIPVLQLGLFEGCASLPPLKPFATPVDVDQADHRAQALARRLLDVEDRTLTLHGEVMRLTQRLSEEGGSARVGSWFDAPRTRHDWPLADQAHPGGSTSLYDRRPDDSVVHEAKQGAEFFAAHSVNGDMTDFLGAVTELNRVTPAIQIDHEEPDVSIVVPVYGQLPYTLNCIHSVLGHKSRYSVEIIVVDDCSPDNVTGEFLPQVKNIRYHRQLVNNGFIASCNTGGEIARGKYLLLLNNDTRVVEGWLDNALDSFHLFPKAGLVGSKMLYPDGALQEAGGILWRDGSAWNYGRNDDPNRPQYCYSRQVDYVSGCSIVLRTDLWRELGGFDKHFAPAYAEDADLCQRVSARGLEIWFQPTSRVIHYEGKTSGTQTTGGVKAYQIVNLRKLFLRWRTKFELHRPSAEAPYFEKERNVIKRILFVDAVTPTPDQDAGSVQTVLGLRCAQRAGYKAHFVPEDNWLFDPKYTPLMQREGVECFYAPFDVGFDNFVARYGQLFDVVVVYRVGVMHKCLLLLKQSAPNALLLFHLADLHYLRMQRQAELEHDHDLATAAAEMKNREIKTILESDCTITHSTVEAEIIAAEAPGAPVTVWPLMMEVVGTSVDFDGRRDVCFLGGYRHPPNVDAVLFFVAEVLPLLHAVRPELRLIVAGAHPPPEIVELAGERIVVTGMVENLSDVFDISRVFVCPLRVGAGAKGKVMSALAHGLPIVSTAIGVEGAGLENGEHVLVADSPAAMAEAILRVYDDRDLWRRLSKAGLSLIQNQFSLDMGVDRLEEAIEKGYRKRLGLLNA